MTDVVSIIWDLVESFINTILGTLEDDLFTPIMTGIFDKFFTLIFVDLAVTTGFLLVFTIFLYIFYRKFVFNAGGD